jgi:hypothetical protein
MLGSPNSNPNPDLCMCSVSVPRTFNGTDPHAHNGTFDGDRWVPAALASTPTFNFSSRAASRADHPRVGQHAQLSLLRLLRTGQHKLPQLLVTYACADAYWLYG